MRYMVIGMVLFSLVFSLQAQDGIYGSFTLGQKIVNLDPLNERLQTPIANGGLGIDVEFVNNYWILGGEGHIILGKHFVIGGKGVAMWNEEEVPDTNQTIKIVGGMGLGFLGYAFLAGTEKQIRLIPEVGVGMSSFLLQNKSEFQGGEDDFDKAFLDDKRSVLTKVGLALDVALAFDWYIKVIELVKIIPGLGFGPLIHAEAGYTIVPGNTEWVRDVNDAGNDQEPDLSFNGFYFNVGVGIGLSSSRQ